MSASSLAIQNSIQLYGGQSLPDVGAGDIASLQSSAQAYLDDNTTTSANDARISNGAAAGASLIQNGYNPDNPDDNQKLVTAIAGGVSLIPGGAVIGAVIIGMYEIGTQVIAPLVDKICGYSSTPTCSSSGNWTTLGVLANSGINGLPAPGSLAGFVIPALGKAYSQVMNCDAFNRVPGTIPFGFQMTIAPLLKMWNQSTDGDLVDYFVPRVNVADWPGGVGGGGIFFGNINCAAGPFCDPVRGAYAFQPISQVPEWGANNNHILDPATEGSEWMRIAANAGPLKSTAPRVVKLSLHYGGASATNPGTSITTSSSSTGATVAKGAAWTIAGLGAAGLLYGWAVGKGAGYVFDKAWLGAKKLFDRPVHVGEALEELRDAISPSALLEDATSNPLLVGESRGTAVQSLLFSKSRFTVATAKSWASRHGYTSRKVDVTAKKIRLRQHPPGSFKRMRTVQFGPGISAVIGWK